MAKLRHLLAVAFDKFKSYFVRGNTPASSLRSPNPAGIYFPPGVDPDDR